MRKNNVERGRPQMTIWRLCTACWKLKSTNAHTQVVYCSLSFHWLQERVSVLRGSFQKCCTLYVFSLKMNLFYKIHLQAFSIISIVLYHSGPTLGKVLYSCLDAFVVDASDQSDHLIRHLLNASEAHQTLTCSKN
jgi:hypothetical protein